MSSLYVDATQVRHVEMQQCDVATIVRPAGVRLTCLSGFSWVTQGSESRDLVLYPGQTLVLVRRKPFYVSALHSCKLRVEAPSSQPSTWSRAGTLAIAWLRRPMGLTA